MPDLISFAQLLDLVVRKERPDLADLGEQLVEQQNGFKIKMKELEDNILYKLASAEGINTEGMPEFRHEHGQDFIVPEHARVR